MDLQEEISRLRKKGLDPEMYSMLDDGSIIRHTYSQGRTPIAESTPVEPPDEGATKAFTRSAKRSIIPTIGGVAAGAVPLALATGPVGWGTVGASIGLGALGSYLGGLGQDAVMPLSEVEQRNLALSRERHPVASFAGELAPTLIGFRPDPSALWKAGKGLKYGISKGGGSSIDTVTRATILNAGVGAGVGAGSEAVMEKIQGEELDPMRIAGQAGAGALLNKPWLLGKKLGYTDGSEHTKKGVAAKPTEPVTVTNSDGQRVPVAADYSHMNDNTQSGQPTVIPGVEMSMTGESGPLSKVDVGYIDPIEAARKEQEMLTNQKVSEAMFKEKLVQDTQDNIQKKVFGNTPGTDELVQKFQSAVDDPTTDRVVKTNPEPGEDVQDRYDREDGKYDTHVKYQEASSLPAGKNQSKLLTSTLDDLGFPKENRQRITYMDLMKKLASRRGVSLEEKAMLKDLEGNPVAGVAYIKKRLALVSTDPTISGLDTPIHEIAHHWIEDMRTGGSDFEKSLIAKGEEIYGGNEGLTENIGVSNAKDLIGAGINEGDATRWMKEFWSAVKARVGMASDKDILRLLNTKLLSDPALEISTLNPKNNPRLAAKLARIQQEHEEKLQPMSHFLRVQKREVEDKFSARILAASTPEELKAVMDERNEAVKQWEQLNLSEEGSVLNQERSSMAGSKEENIEMAINKEQIMHLLGPSLYSADHPQVTMKELFQNSFDALKEAIYKGKIESGNIDITTDRGNHTITMKDDGVGMSPDIVKKAFFTIGGSVKDVPPELRSGGLGLAKLGVMLGADNVKVVTVRDGVKTSVDVKSDDIRSNKFPLRTESTNEPNGTSVEITVPESFLDKNGEKQGIYFPSNFNVLRQPFINDKINVKFNGKEVKPIIPPAYTTARFNWGTADIYVSKKQVSYPEHKVLSSGIYQFEHQITKSPGTYEALPFNVIIDVKPNVGTKDTFYPFNNQRESWRPSVKQDIDGMISYLQRMGRASDEEMARNSFDKIYGLPKVDVAEGLSSADKQRLRDIGNYNSSSAKVPDRIPTYFSVDDSGVVDDLGKRIIEITEDKYGNKKFGDPTFKVDKEIELRKSVDISHFNDKDPQYHNNTSQDYLEVPGAKEVFAKLASIVHDAKSWAAHNLGYGYDILDTPDQKYFAGVSIDKEYGGVHTNYPFKSVFINPLAFPNHVKSSSGMAGYWAHVILHELSHTTAKNEGADFTSTLADNYAKVEDTGHYDQMKVLLRSVAEEHMSTINQLKELYDGSRTKNTGKSLKGGEKLRTRESRSNEADVSTGGKTGRGSERNDTSSTEVNDSGGLGALLEAKNRTDVKYQSESTFAKPPSVDPANPNVPSPRWSLFNIIKPAIDRVGEIHVTTPPKGHEGIVSKLQSSLAKMLHDSVRLTGKFSDGFVQELHDIKATRQEMDRVNEWRTLRREGEDNSNIILTDREQKINDIFDVQRKITREESVNSGMEIKLVDKSGNPHFREIGEDPNWHPMMLSIEAGDEIRNRGVRRDELLEDIAQYWLRRSDPEKMPGYNITTARKEAADFARALASDRSASTKDRFNALRKAEGLGLPKSVRETNGMEVFTRYGKRAAKDIATFTNLELPTDIRSVLDWPDSAGSKADNITALQKLDLGNDPRVKEVLTFNEFDGSNSDTIIRAAMRVVNAALIGPVSATRNIFSSWLHYSTYMKAEDIAGSVAAMQKIGEGYNLSTKLGVNRDSVLDYTFGTPSINKTVDILNKVSEGLTVWQGRAGAEKFSRAMDFVVGRYLAEANFGRAMSGDVESLAFLKDFGKDIGTPIEKIIERGGLNDGEMNEIAASFVERVQGTYDARGLPYMTSKGIIAPFLQLSKWGIEKANVINKDIITPVLNGQPGAMQKLIVYAGGAVLTGEAVKAVTDILNQKVSPQAGVIETFNSPYADTDDYVRALVNTMQMASFAGILGDTTKMMLDAAHGDMPRGFSFPLASFVSDTFVDGFRHSFEAVKEGADPVETGLAATHEGLKNMIQAYRVIQNWIDVESTAQRNASRDLNIFREQQGTSSGSGVVDFNPLIGADERKFKNSTNPQESAQMGQSLMQKYLADSRNKPVEQQGEYLNRKISGLRRMPISEFPNAENNPREMRDYIEFIRATKGELAASEAMKQYARRRGANEFKLGMLPTASR